MEDSSNAAGDASLPLGPARDAAGKGDADAGKAVYRVLARKYRPARFEDLIGQEAMVKTLSNAFDLDRIHQAYILTGVRGVGKTTTARILARAFNYELPARGDLPAVTRPTIHMQELGVHCQAIIDSRHVDVIEMDAASHTGIDDVREIIESARYRPVLARTKVYIIDEVHMLSKQAFNGLLKTLEEPPDHVRFLFATTEIDKVPVTVRSRCQRFDLRRIDADALVKYLASICAKEAVAVDEDALALIARAAEGSARDALSLLDQAIAHGAAGGQTSISAESLRLMLGLADRSLVIDLFEAVMQGKMAGALGSLKGLYDCGADPAEVLVELAEFVHLVTRLKLAPDAAQDPSLSPEERARGLHFAQALSVPVLTRAWQLLSKGQAEAKDSPRPLAAADMVLVRLAYAADLPTPDEALRRLAAAPTADREVSSAGKSAPQRNDPIGRSGGSARAAVALQPRQSEAPPVTRIARFEDVVALAGRNRDIQLKLALERDVRLVRFEDGAIEFSLAPGASPQLAQNLMRRLQEWTGQRWLVAISREPGAPSLKEQEEAKAREAMTGVCADPLVRSVLAYFPGAEIVAVRTMEQMAQAVPPEATAEGADDDIGFADDSYTDVEL
ncbi:DNA polymerase III subunit gamma/tau [Methylocapsa polymorpha]|uniref:DNA polymerase III subunit gamma/tau n=1 Tax=Methylocapsa polymorpha TaxID=3080828 RepID=A0ABZ0HR94_9HYPH|nr:DNA polymerase III subunit gamma/tau [Methylocapsa sp. RX1]